jgi:NADH dehydrogenase/NADH:ubiquinone oxidoreductase subunit G
MHGHPSFAFARRGFNTTINFYGDQGSGALSIETCSACAEICPVGALILKK